MKIINPVSKSRSIKFSDLLRVFWDSLRIKYAMLGRFESKYPFACSISHCQMSEKDPLRFFVVDKEGGEVTKGGVLKKGIRLSEFFGRRILFFVFPARVIINPVIIQTSTEVISGKEACMSLDFQKPRKLTRFESVKLRYWTIWGKQEKWFHLNRARIIQHELGHFDGISIEDVYKHRIEKANML